MNKTAALIVVAATLLGLAIGVGTATVKMSSAPWPGEVTYGPNPLRPSVGVGVAKVSIDNPHHEFGVMDVDDEGRHDFIFTNEGTGPLILAVDDTSCRCTASKVHRGEVPPGESTKVSLKWTADEHIGKYRQTAKIRTNDPNNQMVELTVSGRIKAAVYAAPRQVDFPRLAVGETATAEAMLYCTLDETLEMGSFKLSDQDTAQYFDVELEPLETEQFADIEDVKSGYSLKVTVKPGLPLGPFTQTILIATGLESSPAVVVPVAGTLVSDISIVGRGWNRDAGVLVLTVKSSQGLSRRFQLIVRGTHRNDVKFAPLATVPDSLKITVGETRAVGEGAATQTPLTVEIPKGSPPCAYLGPRMKKFGEIVLKTNHPFTPELRIPVKIAIEGQ